MVEVEVKNKFVFGDSFELMMLKGNVIFILEVMENCKGEVIDDVKGNGYFVYILVLEELDFSYVLLMCNLV